MPSTLTIRMAGDADKHHGPYIASLMQGVLMEQIDYAFAKKMHESGIHPYSQYIEESDNEILWHVNTLTDEAEDAMLYPLLDTAFKDIELKHREEILHIKEKTVRKCTYEELIEAYYMGECSRYIPLSISTPMAFRQNGRYCIIPSTRLIFQSLMMRFDACSPDSSIFTEELLTEFESLTEIADYRLRSVRFNLEGIKIPSFAGDLKIHVNGPGQMANVAWMLAKFGEFSGIGIKTGIGMGAVKAAEYRRRKQPDRKGKGDPVNG